MKKISTTILLLCIGATALFSQAVPELLYYKFDGSGTSVPNLASAPPVGTATATLMGGLTQGPTGQCGGAVIGSGVSSTTDYVNTGYATNLTGTSWTISMYTKDITPSATLFYIFGDAGAGSFRCFTNGVAGPNNWILRGTFTDVLVTGGATVAPHVTTFVYDMTLGNIKAYLDGVLVNTVAQTGPVIAGAGPFKVIGYSANVGAPAGGKLDEFRLYNRALSATEVALLVNPPAVFSAFNASSCNSYTVPSGDETYTTSGIYMDTIPSIAGCGGDSIMTITVSLNNNTSSFSTNACGTYTVPSGDETYATSGIYMDTIPNVSGCDSVMTINVTVNSLPAVSASAASGVVCSGSPEVLTASGASSYSWSSGGTASTETVFPTSMSTYTVTGTDGNGCINTATVMVMVNALPIVNLGSDVTACGSAMFDAQNAGSTYLWSDASTNQTLTVTASGTYLVMVTDANGCMNFDTAMATINALPTVTLGTDFSQCEGTATLDAQNAGSTYLWNDASTNQTLLVSASGTYAVMVTDANGCVISDTILVTINSNPIVNLGADVVQCGGTVMFDAQNAGSTYLWSDASTAQTLLAATSGTYFVLVTDANGCFNSDTAMATINTLPTVGGTASSTAVCLDDAAVSLTGTPSGGTWSGTGVSGSSFSPMTAGVGAQTATYSFTDANSCTNTATVVITVNACVSVAEQSLQAGVSVYPNPNNGIFTLAVNSTVGDLKIVITDIQGRVVYSSTENNVNAGFIQQINLQTESAGIYLLQISGNGQQRFDKIAVVK